MHLHNNLKKYVIIRNIKLSFNKTILHHCTSFHFSSTDESDITSKALSPMKHFSKYMNLKNTVEPQFILVHLIPVYTFYFPHFVRNI